MPKICKNYHFNTQNKKLTVKVEPKIFALAKNLFEQY